MWTELDTNVRPPSLLPFLGWLFISERMNMIFREAEEAFAWRWSGKIFSARWKYLVPSDDKASEHWRTIWILSAWMQKASGFVLNSDRAAAGSKQKKLFRHNVDSVLFVVGAEECWDRPEMTPRPELLSLCTSASINLASSWKACL